MLFGEDVWQSLAATEKKGIFAAGIEFCQGVANAFGCNAGVDAAEVTTPKTQWVKVAKPGTYLAGFKSVRWTFLRIGQVREVLKVAERIAITVGFMET